MALLGSGFDPGVTNVFCAYVQKHLLDEIQTLDIVDCNGGSHGKPFATNFNPEINIREITARGPPLLGERRMEGDRRRCRSKQIFDFDRGRREEHLPHVS